MLPRRLGNPFCAALAGSVAVHLLLGAGLVVFRNSLPSGTATVLAPVIHAHLVITPFKEEPSEPAQPPTFGARKVPEAGVLTSSQPPRQPAELVSVGPSEPPAQVERFLTASELDRLPALPGEPLIDLSDAGPDAQGVLLLRLDIDERGKVVEHYIELDEGLPPHVSQRIQRAFSGYVYVPGEVAGRTVKAQVRMQIAVREGQANINEPR